MGGDSTSGDILVKICRKCKLEQPLENYHIDVRKVGKRKHECRSCCAEIRKLRTMRQTPRNERQIWDKFQKDYGFGRRDWRRI